MGEMANYIALAIPVFFVLIGLELWWSRRERRQALRLNDAVSDLSTGTLQQILGLFSKAALVGLYALVWSRLGQLEISTASAWAWVACFLGVDFFYYWFHRFSHESTFAWGAHVVHHQSEDYNLAVALRQSALQQFVAAPFYWPLAIVGFPPVMFLACSAFNTLYQFWIHTEAIGRLGPLEWFLNTPSHHRVHHGSNPQYIDRNHGGTFIVWDRLFGTFEPEGERVVYGVTKPPKSWNPIWVQVHYFRELWRVSRTTGRWSDKVRVWFKEPGWLPDDVDEPEVTDNALHGSIYDARPPDPLGRYVLWHFALSMTAAFVYIYTFDDLSPLWKAAGALWLTWSLVNASGVLETRAWLPASEVARLAAAATLAGVAAPEPWRWVSLGAIAVIFGLSVWALSRHREAFGAAAATA